MKITIKTKDVQKREQTLTEERYEIADLTLLELKSIHRGLLMFAEQYNNNQVRAMASTIYSSVLKDREIQLHTPADIEAIKRRERAMMETLKSFTPVSHTILPTPY